MKKFYLIIIGILLGAGFTVAAAAPVQQVVNGGTGSSTLTGILIGNGKSSVNTLTVGSNLTLTGTTLSASSGGGSGTVSTSTNETSGSLSYWTSNSATPALLGKVSTSSIGAGTGLTFSGTAGAQVGGTAGTFSVNTSQNITTLSNFVTAGTVNTTASGVLYVTGTSTPSVNAPITYSGTFGSFMGGVSGSFSCTNASSGVTGCLTGTDWNTFNGKSSFSFTPTTNYAVNTNATGTIMNFTVGIQASSTSHFNVADFTGATSTFFASLQIATTSQTAFNIRDQYGTSVFNVNTASSTGPIFTIQATSSNITLWSTDQYGHTMASSTMTPVLSSCGTTPALTVGSNDTYGEVTMGTTATGCVITFGTPYASAPFCTVDWEATPLASQSDSVSATAITLTQTSTSNNKVVYQCFGK